MSPYYLEGANDASFVSNLDPYRKMLYGSSSGAVMSICT